MERVCPLVRSREGWAAAGRLTTQLIRLPPEKAKSKNAPKQVETLVRESIPNGPRLKSAVDMLYVCGDAASRGGEDQSQYGECAAL